MDCQCYPIQFGRRFNIAYREPQAFRQFHSFVFTLNQALGARHNRDTGLRGQIASSVLQPEGFDAFWGRTREDNPCSRSISREIRILRQKSVARDDRVDIILFRDFYNLVPVCRGQQRLIHQPGTSISPVKIGS